MVTSLKDSFTLSELQHMGKTLSFYKKSWQIRCDKRKKNVESHDQSPEGFWYLIKTT